MYKYFDKRVNRSNHLNDREPNIHIIPDTLAPVLRHATSKRSHFRMEQHKYIIKLTLSNLRL